jgi:uncharacterized small protein (DUF1192 family)
MGYFDDVVKKEETKRYISNLENAIKELFQTYISTYKSLERSPNYSKKLLEEKEKAFRDFTEYFQSKNFNVGPSIYSNVQGLTATLGDFKAEFFYQGGEFQSRINGIEYETLTLEDKKAEKRHFQGHVHNDQITIFGNFSEDEKIDVYSKATEDLQKDIALLKEKIENQYEPEFHYYLNERQKYVNSIKDYLELVNEELSQK